MLGHHPWRADDGRLKWYLDLPSPNQLKKNIVKVGPTLTKLSGSAHGLYLIFTHSSSCSNKTQPK